jgi:hypothetical protein
MLVYSFVQAESEYTAISTVLGGGVGMVGVVVGVGVGVGVGVDVGVTVPLVGIGTLNVSRAVVADVRIMPATISAITVADIFGVFMFLSPLLADEASLKS